MVPIKPPLIEKGELEIEKKPMVKKASIIRNYIDKI
jgi:hypothetical protein